jgi:hypothetical protein
MTGTRLPITGRSKTRTNCLSMPVSYLSQSTKHTEVYGVSHFNPTAIALTAFPYYFLTEHHWPIKSDIYRKFFI